MGGGKTSMMVHLQDNYAQYHHTCVFIPKNKLFRRKARKKQNNRKKKRKKNTILDLYHKYSTPTVYLEGDSEIVTSQLQLFGCPKKVATLRKFVVVIFSPQMKYMKSNSALSHS